MGPLRKIAFSMLVSAVVSACVHERPAPSMTAAEALAATSPLIDCEWNAARRFDDSRTPIAQLAERIMDVCTDERIKAKRAFGLSPNDPVLEADDFRDAVEIVEEARKTRSTNPS